MTICSNYIIIIDCDSFGVHIRHSYYLHYTIVRASDVRLKIKCPVCITYLPTICILLILFNLMKCFFKSYTKKVI